MGYKRMARSVLERASKRARTVLVPIIKRRVKKYVTRRLKKMPRMNKALRLYNSMKGGTRINEESRRSVSFSNITSDTLSFQELTLFPEGVTTGTREANNIILKGIKFELYFRNLLTTNNTYLNVALITSKNSLDPVPKAFFRSQFLENNIDFSDAGLTPFAKHKRAINADLYIIHWHKRILLNRVDSAIHLNKLIFRMSKYMKFNTRLSFTDRGSGEKCDQPIYLVIYCNPDAQAVAAPATNQIAFNQDIRIIYGGE
jgi:hypothetical protein